MPHPVSRSPDALPPELADYETVAASLRRASWTIVLVLTGILAAAWVTRLASGRRVEWATDNRESVRVALVTELSAATWDAAVRLALVTGDSTSFTGAARAAVETRANLDTLAALAVGDSGDVRRLATIQAALSAWDRQFASHITEARPLAANETRDNLVSRIVLGSSLFAALRRTLDEDIRAENVQYHERISAQSGTTASVGLVFFGGVIVLSLVVFQMRRQLGMQLAGAVKSKRIIEEQNRELRERADHQYALADEGRRLNRRLTEGQRVAQLGYWEIDAVSGDVFWSDEMYHFCGLEPGIQPPPTNLYLERVHPDDRQRMQEMTAQAVLNLQEFTEQYRLSDANGKLRTVQAKGRLLVDAHGKRKLIGTVQDVTERVQLESQLRQSQKMDAVGRLAGGVAHDFNNMLTVVGGYSQLLRAATPNNPELHPLIEEILSATRRASQLTQQLLAFSRGRVLQPQMLDVRETVRDTESLWTRLIGEDVELVLRLDGPTPLVLADPTQITQVLMNLVVNARDAMPTGGRLIIETGTVVLDQATAAPFSGMRAGVHAVITVSDTGVGMNAETQARIFEPFFTTKPEGQGTGLGLSTVFGIVQQSGGGVWVYSEPGQGTTFKIHLPEFTGDMPDEVSVADLAPARRTAQAAMVLVVEDDEIVRRVSRTILEQRGYMVVEATNGVEALTVLHEVHVDVVITDTVMPKMGGRELAGRLAAERPNLPVILTSGYTADTLQRQGPIPDLVLFLEKPFEPDALDSIVQEAMRRAIPHDGR